MITVTGKNEPYPVRYPISSVCWLLERITYSWVMAIALDSSSSELSEVKVLESLMNDGPFYYLFAPFSTLTMDTSEAELVLLEFLLVKAPVRS